VRDVDWDQQLDDETTLEEYAWLRLRWFRQWRDDGHGDGSTGPVWYAVRVRLDVTDAELRLLRDLAETLSVRDAYRALQLAGGDGRPERRPGG